MAIVKVSIGYTIFDGLEVRFKSPLDYDDINGLTIAYPNEEGTEVTKDFVFMDSHMNDITDLGDVFKQDAIVKVILDCTHGNAFIQNADTNAYLEGKFNTLFEASIEHDAHINDKNNPHAVTATQVGADAAGSAAQALVDAKAYTDTHANSKSNPHEVTAAQVGARPNTWTPTASDVGADATGSAAQALADAKTYADQKVAAITPGGLGAVTPSEVEEAATQALSDAKAYTDTHANSKSNPHEVTAAQVGADPSGTAASAVSTHNTNTDAHNDIRELITGLTTRINTALNSTDVNLDQMAEIVTYIKNNKSLIDGITTNKVNVADIIDNLTTNVTNKPLSAAQGVAIKALIDALQTAVNGKAAASHGTHVEYSTTAPVVDGTASAGSAATVARSDHKHPTDTSRAAASDLTSHTGNKSNPHGVTAAQVGARPNTWTPTAADVGARPNTWLPSLSDIGAAPASHGTHVTWSTTTPKANGTAAVGSETNVARGDHVHPTDTSRAAASDLTSHTGNKSNPHGVTASQVGLGNVNNTSDANKPVSTAQATAIADAKAAGTTAQTNLSTHTSNKSNPHGVTAAQVGARPSTWLPSLSDIGAAPAYSYGTSDYTAGSTALATGKMHLVYE